MDILFGTYTCPDHEPDEVGIPEDFPQNYVGQMIHPLLPASISKKLGGLKLPSEKSDNPSESISKEST